MNLAEAANMLENLAHLEIISHTATTPDGRWQILQEWLDENPKWKKQVNAWVEMTPDEALAGLFKFVSKQADMPAVILERLVNEQIRERAKSAIQTIQLLYKERKANKHGVIGK